MGYIQIYWTCGNLEEAREIVRRLVEKKLVACANIIPGVESVFMWDNQVSVSQEIKVIFKTRESCFEAVKACILEYAEYKVPAILKVPITGGHAEYLDWVKQNTL